ncbi:MAG TPA: hypothetical protein VL990_14245 [Acidobacteriaceae bacterium]|nr:hypothetical protein [Acidobacteriaceae bacterium]
MNRDGIRWLVLVGLVVLGTGSGVAQAAPAVTGDTRVDELLSKMTLAEKIALIHGTQDNPAVYQGQAGYPAGVQRLGIPGLRLVAVIAVA